jgi:cytochrome P450
MARRAEIEQLARELLAPVLAALRRGETVDIVPVLDAMAGRVVLGMLNFSQPREEEFTRLCKILLEASAFMITPDHPLYSAKAEAKAQVYAFLEHELHDRLDRMTRGERPTDLIALIAQAEGRSGITRTVALSNLFNVFVGGGDTTVRWMGNAIVLLHQHPEALAELRANPAFLPQALEEVMRIRSVTRFAIRAVKVDGVELAGQAMPRGDTVYLMGSIANLDPDVFEDPERFDIHRKPKPHLGFSHGMHLCIGMNLARIEAQIFLRQLLLAPDAPTLDIVEADYGDESVVRGPERLLLRMAG